MILDSVFQMRESGNWWRIIHKVAASPTEQDYIRNNWTHRRIARDFALIVQREAIESYTGN